jgi:hypothetical protein
MVFHVIRAMAQFERALIQERVRAGIHHARAKGKRLGRPTVIVGCADCPSARTGSLPEGDRKAASRENAFCPSDRSLLALFPGYGSEAKKIIPTDLHLRWLGLLQQGLELLWRI